MSARVILNDVRENKVLWENPNLVFRQEYEAQSGQTQLDPTTFFGQDQNALESDDHRICPLHCQRDPRGVLTATSPCQLRHPLRFRKQIESGSVGPLYLLQGEDEIEKAALSHEFER
jgi:hypothetical protein